MKYLSVLLIILVVSCSSNDDDQPAPQPTGKISGELRLTDEFGIEQPAHSFMMISVTGGQNSHSAADGKFQISGLIPATYNLVYEKAGYGTFRKFNITLPAGASGIQLNGIEYLGKISTTEITGLAINYNSNDSTYSIGCTLSPLPTVANQRAFRLFFGKENTVDQENYLFTPANSWVATTATGTITGFPRDQFYNNGFAPGETVYAIAFGESLQTNTYINPVNGKKVFPNVNADAPSNVVSFTLP